MAEFVEIFEVGPRDGLQNEPRPIPTAAKIALVDLLSQTGFRRIEVASFVSPKWVPQMSDGAEVLAGITRLPGVSYAALAPNLKGYRAAVAAGADEVAVFVSASEGFSKANLNCSVPESLERLASIAEAARHDGTRLRGYVSMVVECPFDGPTPPASVARVAAALRDLGCAEISLGDTVGRATAEGFDAMLAAVLDELPADRLAAHCHDTAGRALEVIDAALARGLRVVDAAVGGLGGCPYAPGAAGNVATEKVAAHLAAKGFETGLDPDRLAEAAALARRLRAG
ncbi:hydroxymethylglutaryl-CoA lyase [Cereibacter sphaeroides]|uniref:hydroxymethylglutaryl-CoA lyase n=1 Tax=Cereibacter sphaeroides TaxID=1063 RepID=UPI001F422998|nr:hydroxymethylglutaryl-CoA lyase [Cereibacter sphaeroides]MCE6960376.1 hydroxymethylglutaryl-CoA lyase [Cereibacter sphaeroides]MCE6969325.1 hydroxymethylglutaryl-CoA lyase [Cereibacter sphaeroides]MCE6975384.1 hydroxymethylglutaryl-CoA lyase [Cereibacter sphaeroides]